MSTWLQPSFSWLQESRQPESVLLCHHGRRERGECESDFSDPGVRCHVFLVAVVVVFAVLAAADFATGICHGLFGLIPGRVPPAGSDGQSQPSCCSSARVQMCARNGCNAVMIGVVVV